MSSRIGRYEIDAKIGEGGMAEVLLARATGIGGFSKTVVIKRLLARLAQDPVFNEMFLDEARVSAALNHPNIVQVFEIGEDQGLPYLAMEYLDGPNLDAILKRQSELGGVDLIGGVRAITCVAEALAYAHRAVDAAGVPMNLVHRDVTPQNVMVTMGGAVKLVDFGVARTDTRATKTRTGVIKGKLHFMSPEQIIGEAIDLRTDVFACGVCLYLATTGRYPFEGENEFQVFNAIVKAPIIPPTRLMEGYPPELERIVLQALSQQKETRYQDAGQLWQALLAFLSTAAPTGDPKGDLSNWVGALFGDWEETRGQRCVPIAGWDEGSSGTQPSLRSPRPSAPTVPAVDPTVQRPLPADAPEAPDGAAPPGAGGRARKRVWGLVGLAVLGLCGAGVAVWLTPRPETNGGPARPLPASETERLEQYLVEIDRLSREQRLAQAEELVVRAEQLPGPTAAQASRLADLKVALRRAASLATAEGLAREGKNREAAVVLHALLDEVPDHPAARRLLLALESPPPSPALATPETGLVVIDSHPSAQVVIDGVSHGHTPVSGLLLPPGPHQLELRREGFVTRRLGLEVVAGQTSTLTPTLVRAAAGGTQLALARPEPAVPGPPPAPSPGVTPPAPPGQEPLAPSVPSSAPKPKELPPRLPETYSARSVQELMRVLRIIEGELSSRGGVSPQVASTVTVPLAEALAADFSPGSAMVLLPRATFYFVTGELRRGANPVDIAQRLKQAHLEGTLAATAR